MSNADEQAMNAVTCLSDQRRGGFISCRGR